MPAPPLNQIAFSVIDLRLTERWFREGLGFAPSGGNRTMMRGPLAARVQGLTGAASTCWWLVGRNPWFQLELFQFEQPLARPLPVDFRPCDIGYSRIGLWVEDFDSAMGRLGAIGTRPLAAPAGPRGARRAFVRSPDGVYVEIMEDDPLGPAAPPGRNDCPVAVRSVTLSVPDLDRSVSFFRGLGLEEWQGTLHKTEHEAACGLYDAWVRTRVLMAGDVLVEIAQYLDPLGRPWPRGYQISDQGILNIAFGARNKADHALIYERAIAAGATPNFRPVHVPGAGVVYVNDADGFSVELLWAKPGKSDRKWGFEPMSIERRPPPDTHAVEARVHIAAPLRHVWQVVSDHEAMSAWSGFNPVVVSTEGQDERNGHGSRRTMKGPAGSVVEQVVAWDPPFRYRYRVVEGSPFVCHQGDVQLEERNGGTELTWRIRFRPRIRGTGAILRTVMQQMLKSALRNRLKPLIESSSGDGNGRQSADN